MARLSTPPPPAGDPEPTQPPGPPVNEEAALEHETDRPRDVRGAAVRGVAALGARTLWVRALGLASNVVLARLLSPSDFGLVAIGTAVVAFATAVSDGGVGVGLIRGAASPTRAQLRALVGLQLVMGALLAVLATGVALLVGEAAGVTAAMVSVVPLLAFRAPIVVGIERRMAYGTVAVVESVEALVYVTWAVAAVLLGAGVWGLVTASVVRPLVGLAILLRREPEHAARPSFRFGPLRPVLGFGFRFQLVSVIGVVRDQGLNIAVAAVGGVAALGLWSFAWRLMQVPYLLISSLWRVAFPAMSHLVEQGEDVRGPLRSSSATAALLVASVLVPLAACAPAAIPVLLGDQWEEVSPVIPWCALALSLSGPVAAVGTGYLAAIGEARVLVRAAVLHSIAWVAAALALLGPLGVQAVGLGWAVGALVDLVVIGVVLERRSGASVMRSSLDVTAVGAAIVVPTSLLTQAEPATLPVALVAALAAGAVFALVAVLVWRPRVRSALGLLRHARPAR